MIDTSQVSIVIPHLGSTKEQEYALEQCRTSLTEIVPNIKILVAKNGSECAHNGDIWVREQDQGTAVNAAVATTNTEWIMVSNDDMIYAPKWWERLTEYLSDNVLCVSPKLIEPNQQHAPTFDYYFCGGAGGDFDKPKWLEFAKIMIQPQEGMSQSPSRHELRTGFNLPFLIKRELWDTIGGYDINYDPWGSNSDSDLEYKIKLAGVQSYQNTNCIVYHFSNTTPTFSSENHPYWQKNWDYFISKWGFERTSSPAIWQADFKIPVDKLKYKPEWINKYA